MDRYIQQVQSQRFSATCASQPDGGKNQFGLSLGHKLGLLAAVFLLLWLGHLVASYISFKQSTIFIERIDEAGRLRMYGQRIAFLVENCAEQSGVARALCRDAIELSIQHYASSLKMLESTSTRLLFQRNRQEIQAALAALQLEWVRYREAAEAVIEPVEDVSAGKAYIQQHADLLLDRAEALVAAFVSGQIRAQWWRNLLHNFLEALGLLLLLIAAYIGRRQIVLPVREIARLARLASSGDYSGRSSYSSRDEMGELVDAFNASNARTQALIKQLAQDQTKAQRAEAQAKSLLEAAADGVLMTDAAGNILQLNVEIERIFGYSRQELLGLNIQALTPPTLWERHAAYLADFIAEPRPRTMARPGVVPGLRKDGSQVPLEISLSSVLLDGQVQLISVVRDVTERMLKEADRQRLLSIVDATPDLVAVLTPELEWVYLNPAGRRLLGIPADAELGQDLLLKLLPPPAQRLLRDVGLPTALATGNWSGELELQDISGRQFPVSQLLIAHLDEQGRPTHVSAMARDISERRRYEADLLYQATHDQLTGLANRVLFRDRLEQAFYNAGRSGKRIALLFIDLDDFKLINDSMGHAAGDILLRKVAQRLQSSLRQGDTRARFGGDEFAVILENIVATSDVLDIVENLTNKLHQPMSLNGRELVITTSIGISLYPGDASTVDELLLHADTAMYSAKAGAGGSYRLFSDTLVANS